MLQLVRLCLIKPERGSQMKLIPIVERNSKMCCWFCRTDKSVKYKIKVLNTNQFSENIYIDVLVCNRCALSFIR